MYVSTVRTWPIREEVRLSIIEARISDDNWSANLYHACGVLDKDIQTPEYMYKATFARRHCHRTFQLLLASNSSRHRVTDGGRSICMHKQLMPVVVV